VISAGDPFYGYTLLRLHDLRSLRGGASDGATVHRSRLGTDESVTVSSLGVGVLTCPHSQATRDWEGHIPVCSEVGSARDGGQQHAVASGQAAPVAQRGEDADVALASDLMVAGRVGDDDERPGAFADVEAVPGGPVERA
jgi:hypothetical protein